MSVALRELHGGNKWGRLALLQAPPSEREAEALGPLSRHIVSTLERAGQHDLALEFADWALRTYRFASGLYVAVFGPDRPLEDYGLVSEKVVTTAGVNKLVALMNASDAVTGAAFKYHGLGTGTTAENATDTALVTELTTQYNPDSTRATGSQTTGGSANVYRTVGTNTVDAGVTIQEHGVFSQAATGGGTLLDRSLTGGQALSSGDSLQATYDLTIAAGG